ncbi:hypothetical protein ACHAW6_004837 [Cyclotella cf. meneghiniana]
MTDVKDVPIEDEIKVPVSDDDVENFSIDGDEVNPIEDETIVSEDDEEIKVRTEDNEVNIRTDDDDDDLEAPVEDKVQVPPRNIEINVPTQNVEIKVPIRNDQVNVPTNNEEVKISIKNQLKVPTYDKVIKPPPSSSDPLKSNKNLLFNTLNVAGYILNLSTSYLGGVAGWFGGKPNSELSAQYQTLITPLAPFFGYIWGIIFLSQGFFVAAQILPRYKDRPLVQRGVRAWYFGACSAQSAWTVAFGYEFMVTAFVFMVAVLICLCGIVYSQWNVVAEEERKKDADPWLLENNAVSMLREDRADDADIAAPPTLAYWLLRFPFAVHAGWIAPATPLMLSVALVAVKADAQAELWTAVLGVAVLFGMSMGLLLRQDEGAPSYVIPGVVAYACVGIMLELDAPNDSILARFQEGEISLMKNVAGFCGAMLLVTIVSRFFAILLRDHCCRRKYDDEEDDNVIYVEVDDV